jgi:hypothetical protein
VAEVKDVMVENIEKVVERGERFNVLVDKAEGLANTVRQKGRVEVGLLGNGREWAFVFLVCSCVRYDAMHFSVVALAFIAAHWLLSLAFDKCHKCSALFSVLTCQVAWLCLHSANSAAALAPNSTGFPILAGRHFSEEGTTVAQQDVVAELQDAAADCVAPSHPSCSHIPCRMLQWRQELHQEGVSSLGPP